MNEKLEVFKNEFFFNKEEILNNFESFIEYYRNSKDEEYSEQYRKCLLELCEKFMGLLRRSNLPRLEEDWWYYDYVITNDGINLILSFCEEMEINDDKELSSMTSSGDFTLLTVKCDYYSVEQYATIYNVTPVTVRQWIRRGKIRTAQKFGRDWLIPAITDKPTRGFQPGYYMWSVLPQDIEESYPFLKGFQNVYIFQDEKDKTKFDCIMGFLCDNNRKKISLSLKEREKFELDLISNPGIEVEPSGIMYKPSKY